MSGRSSFATPTNVYPKNGQVIVFNDQNEAWLSFTNNTDSMMFTYLQVYNVDIDNINVFNIWNHWYEKDGSVSPFNRGEVCSIRLLRKKYLAPKIMDDMDVYNFEYGSHYSFNIDQFSAFPKTVDDETIYVPNISVKFSSGKILEVISETQIRTY